ncbi:hypothetical protein PVNG_05786 [Plasmodium vivax North Korean]|uniref:Variable surface protein Vir7-like protein n=1 Tax=Plasmodium vivax North Korean TaxID=1035514 RepID=A0A0J9U053_PLAVI|nr:hypothetical protein PVNG_05786 [Plasmodium vivax North Korean]
MKKLSIILNSNKNIDEKLKLLQTKFYYEKLDNGYSGCEYSNYYEAAETELRKNNGLQKVSDKILRALCYVYRQSWRRDSVNDICNFLYYWLGNILLENLDNNLLFTEVILKLFSTLKNDSNDNICELVYADIDEDVFKKIKLIFDYTEDYVKYEMDLVNPNRFCNQQYHSHLTTYVKTYKDLYSKCIVEHHTDKYCQAFKKYYDVNKHDHLYNWSCILKEISEAPSMPVKSPVAAHQGQLEGISVGGSQSELSQPTIKAEEQQVSELPGHGDHTFNERTSETDIIAAPSGDKSSSITSKSITGALSVAGIFVPSYLMYNVISVIIVK